MPMILAPYQIWAGTQTETMVSPNQNPKHASNNDR